MVRKLLIGSPGVTVLPVENAVEQARRNEEKGYDSIWWPDHLMGWIPQSVWTPDLFSLASVVPSPHLFLEPTTTMSIAATHTKRVLLGTAVTDTIRRHPAVLAQTILTLDHISCGRVILGLGAGEAENIVPYGLPYDSPADRLEEAVEVIRLFWESEGKEVNFNGRFWRLNHATLYLPPYGGSHPPIWIASHRRKMLEITGRLADGWLPTFMPIPDYRRCWGTIEHSALSAGRNAAMITRGMWTWLITDRDREECERLLDSPFAKAMALISPSETFESLGFEHPLGKRFYGLRDYIPNRLSRDEAVAAFAKVPREVCERTLLFGTPEEVVEKLEAYVDAGLQHVILWNATYFCDAGKLTSSFRCMDEVLNHFRTEGD
jgi:phthiodiolone/phenolphthiodiolone dimycocerosates ketoreductase